MQQLVQTLLDGVGSGMIYGSLALALVLIHQATRIPNFAQGEMAMLSTFVAWELIDRGLPWIAAVAITLALSMAGGYGLQRGLIRWVERSPHLTQVMVTLGVFMVINGVAGLVWGYLPKTLDGPVSSGSLRIAGVTTSWQVVGMVLVTVGMLLLLYLLFSRSRLGLQLRAAAQNPTSARLAGINVGRAYGIGWGLSAVVGAVAGVMVAPQTGLEPNFMFPILLYAFAGATVGGFSSPGGAVVGGVLVGLVEALTATYVGFIGTELSLTVALVTIVIVLLVRPDGLFGKKEVARV
ncbi:branched-chain amino acid ABC transporter permease [Actinomadura montaniterrae]|jgi:branched-chain amino acid transport system permease protein|uniref:Branched-chain amino acid ABC transporter permease n=1 Tax=Actinomadura montaniterrae TaxID=1803903 RepID=A0A6L3W2F7_9ACTN|nr:branched-chain amino acid ABC transporter permease [Actinomadura montaniterrae]KAB2388715.1 branched-chain amino acid ABC transporter permease [Actinomadura montaniterrae]